MNDVERFLAIARFEKPDYVPIFGFEGAPGISGGVQKDAHDRLVASGMSRPVGDKKQGGLEKEVVNEGNKDMIRPEIMAKVPSLLKQGGYYPNGDHGIQPLVTFPNLCKFITILHEVCHNPEGKFPRC